jgi:hypothetical protein
MGSVTTGIWIMVIEWEYSDRIPREREVTVADMVAMVE